jgi:NAD(P)-dependent dehydrogenase (short-subunit alcohol dehydrogenase family)
MSRDKLHDHLHDKVVWITGASRGIGAALAREFAQYGARIVLSAPETEKDALHHARSLCRQPARHWIVPLDLARPATLHDAWERVRNQAGRVDILVHNAGVTHRSRALETTPDVDRYVMEVNYFGAVELTKIVLPHMIRHSAGGQLVAISSVLGLVAAPERSAYIAAKHALTGFFEALRTEVAGNGIGVTLVFPGYVATDMGKHALGGDGRELGRAEPGAARGMTAGALAAQVVPAVVARKERVVVAGREKALLYLERVSPGLISQIVRRVKVT